MLRQKKLRIEIKTLNNDIDFTCTCGTHHFYAFCSPEYNMLQSHLLDKNAIDIRCPNCNNLIEIVFV